MATSERIRTAVFNHAYTGENRCMPCTAVNLGIAGVIAVLTALVWLPLGIGVLLLSVTLIATQGYLVPGTPTLTKRYAPAWFLALFGKADTPDLPETGAEDVPVERWLLQASVIEPCRDRDDVCLTEPFETAWYRRMDDVREEDLATTELAQMLDLDIDAVTLEEHDGAFVMQSAQGHIGQWESRAALVADIAAVRELPSWVSDWEGLNVFERARLLGGLRIFIETCPVCGGPVDIAEETVESCCTSREVIASTCETCDARVLEAVVR